MATVTAPSARRLQRFVASGGVVWTLVLTLVVIGAVGSEDFRTLSNLSNVSRQAVVLSLVSLGQFVVVLTAGVDLSVGMIVKLTAITSAILIAGQDERTLLGLGIALLLGLAAGATNGLIVTRLRVPAFIATLGTLAVIQGISLLITSTPAGQTSPILNDFWAFHVGRLFGPVILTAGIWVVLWIALYRTVWGRHVYAVGADPHIATVSGVRTRLIQFSAYVVAGLLAAVGGILTVTRAGVGDPNAGFGLEFESLAAVVIGGASLAGGRGRLIGVLGGVLLLSVIGNVFNLLGVAVWYRQLLKGLLILFGAAVYLGKRDQA